MRFVKLFFIVFCFISLNVQAMESQTYYRQFWNPKYHGKLLNYCIPSATKKACGFAVAHRYCKMMGYDKATEATIAYDVGLTNYLGGCTGCKGWNCNAFSKIVCVAKTLHHPVRDYYFRFKTFVLPRMNHYRIDWCYQNGHGCGKRAAFSFCRRMGYMREQNYKKADHVEATRALGNQRLCFGEHCQAFSRITCYR